MARPATPIHATHQLSGVVFEFPSMAAAAAHLNLDHPQIQNCIRGFQRAHKGYTFKATGPLADAPERPKVRQAATLFNEGHTRKSVALMMGLSTGTTNKYIKQARVKGWVK